MKRPQPRHAEPTAAPARALADPYRQAFQKLPLAALLLDAQTRIIAASEQAAELFGVTETALPGAPIKRFLDNYPEPPRHATAPAGEFILDGRHSSGATLVLQVQISPLPEQAGDACMLTLSRADDVAHQLQALFRAAPIGIGIIRERIFTRVNAYFCAMLGYRPEQLIGQSARMIYFSDEEFRRVGEQKYRRLRQTGLGSIDTRFRCRDGEALDVLISSTWLHPEKPQLGAVFTVLDVSDYQRQGQLLRDSEQRAHALLDAMPDLMFRLTRDGIYLDYKGAREDLLLQEPNRLIGKRLEDIAPAEFSRQVLAKIAATLDSGTMQQFEYDLAIPGKGLRQWEARMVPSGHREVIATVRDITTQKADARRLTTLSRVVEQSRDAIMLTDERLRITYVNLAFAHLYGYHLDDLRGHSPQRLSAETEAAPTPRCGHYREVAACALHRRKDGSLFHCQYRISALRDEQQAIIGYLCSQQDISEQLHAMNALRDSEKRYRTLFEKIPQGVVVQRGDGQIIDANPAAVSMLGRSRDELLGLSSESTAWRCIHEDGSPFPGDQHPAMLALQRGELVDNVLMGLHNPRRNELVWLRIDAVPLFEPGKTDACGVFASFTDVTEAKTLQRALAHSQKMEAIGHLTGGVAHEFNNILGSILGFTELAIEQAARSDQLLASYLHQVDIAGERARDLIRQLLIFSRGDHAHDTRPMPLTPMIDEAMKLLGPSLPASIKIHIDVPAEPPLVRVEALHVQQILMNLCLNARDAMRGHGLLQLTVSVGDIHRQQCADCHQIVDGQWLELGVADNGCGIPMENRDMLFQPFFTTKQPGKGSGMGLAVTSGIVRGYGGHILLDSRPGSGSCFRVLFPPCRQAARSCGQTKSSKARHLGPISVLVVDDESPITLYLQELLTRSGVRVEIRDSGDEALRALRQQPGGFDLLISDLTMPGLDGLNLIRQLRAFDRHTPILLCSGYQNDISEDLQRGLNIAAVLQKPLRSGEIMQAIEEALSGRQHPDHAF
jgi:two-component system cell cycle sensor histidine kinase/response regulator CckA